MSFELHKKVWKDCLDIEINTPFMHMKWTDAMNNYGSDKPDTRFEMLLNNISDWALTTECGFFKSAIENGGAVKCIVAKDAASKYSRKELDRLTLLAKKYHAGGLAWLKYENGTLNGSVAKFVSEENKETMSCIFSNNKTDAIWRPFPFYLAISSDLQLSNPM